MSHGHVRLDGEKLRVLRLAGGLTVDELAARTGGRVPARQLYAYEVGQRRCDPARFRLLCEVLGVAAPDLSWVSLDCAELADLRHWAGLVAEEAAVPFGMSAWSLLRAERIGKLPRDLTRARFVTIAARTYGQPRVLVRAALARAEQRGQ